MSETHIEEAKLPCRVVVNYKGKPVSNPIDCLMHRFIHPYDPKTTFWYGAVDMAISLKDFGAMFPDGISASDAVALSVVFEDGMGGLLQCWNFYMEGNYLRLASVGVTGMCKQPPLQ